MTYVFEKHALKSEEERLLMIEAIFDPETKKLLKAGGFEKKTSCLEIGPGRGSILKWMAKHKAPLARLAAVDKSLQYLKKSDFKDAALHEGSFQTFKSKEAFDLIHARYVFVHNPDFKQCMRQIKKMLKPRGILILEEPDFTTATWIDPLYKKKCDRVNDSMVRLFTQKGLDPSLGSNIHDILKQTGFSIHDFRQRVHLEKGASPLANMMAASALALKKLYVQTGCVTNRDVETYIQAAHDPASLAVYYTTHSCIAIKS